MAGTTQYFGISYPTATDYVKDGASNMQTIATGFDSAVAIPVYNNQTGTSYTFVLADAAKTVTSNNAGAVTFTIPPQSSVAWANGTTLTVRNYGAGVVTFAGGSGVTVTNTASTVAQYGSAKVVRTGSDAWTVLPDSGGATGALTLIKSQSFSAVSSVDITSCFNSQYTNYKILLYTSTTTPTANRNIEFQLLSGTTPVTTGYYGSAVGINTVGGSSNYTQNNGSNLVVGVIWDTQPDMNGTDITIFKPFTSLRTNLTSNFFGVSGGSYFALSGGGLQNSTSSYDGFRLSVSGTNFGGVVKVYGLQD